MKKTAKFIAFALSAMLLLGSCGQKADENKQQALINEIVNEATAITLPTDAPAARPADTTAATEASTKSAASQPAADYAVDIDLTEMNPTMIYATVYDIVTSPEQYVGKTLKVNGYFDTGYDESLGARYYFVVIPDATACCLQGLEFISEGKQYPDDFPEERTDICVRGVLDKYQEQGHDYYYIKADMLSVI